MTGLARIPRSKDDDFASAIVAQRRALAERVAGRELKYLAGAAVASEEARGNIENFIGFAQVPVGLAGPMAVDTSAGRREVYVPLASNEGALVASYSRGMRIANAGGGIRARVTREGLSQAPMLEYADAAQALHARGVATESFGEMQQLVATTTTHGALVALDTCVIGKRLIVELTFTTGDAIGINMAARATDLVAAELARRTNACARYVHGQDVEKRANSRALYAGRGRSVVADVTLPRAALAELARVTPEQLVAIKDAYAIGFARLGTHSTLVQAANGLAALFVACAGFSGKVFL